MSTDKYLLLVALATVGFCTSIPVFSSDLQQVNESRGKYLIEIEGCNDCHTAGFALSGGAIPEAKWLLGNSLGFRGPWGITYPNNLRQYIQNVSEDKWASYAKNMKTRPPNALVDFKCYDRG